MNRAELNIIELAKDFNGTYQGGQIAIDNSEMIEKLNGKAVEVKEILGQETFVFGDGSYITRNDDVYYTGDDVEDFLFTEMENSGVL